MTNYFPILNADIPMEKTYLDHLHTSIPNALMTRMHYGSSLLDRFEWSNKTYLLRVTGNVIMTLTLVKIDFNLLYGVFLQKLKQKTDKKFSL